MQKRDSHLNAPTSTRPEANIVLSYLGIAHDVQPRLTNCHVSNQPETLDTVRGCHRGVTTRGGVADFRIRDIDMVINCIGPNGVGLPLQHYMPRDDQHTQVCTKADRRCMAYMHVWDDLGEDT